MHNSWEVTVDLLIRNKQQEATTTYTKYDLSRLSGERTQRTLRKP